MASSTRRNRPPRRSLDDYLHKPQHDYLAREFDIGQQLGPVRWYLRLAPYPLDRETAEAVQGMIDNQVLPWGLLQQYVEDWAYPVFLKAAVATEMTLNGRSREEAEAAVPDLEMLRWHFWGSVPESRVAPWAEFFAHMCDDLLSTIERGLLVSEPSLAGKFVHMPFLPLGANWLSRVPLLDRVWIDRRVVELCEASALLAAKGYTRLPAADAHSFAWHRFFPPRTRWTSPAAAPRSHFIEALGRASSAVRDMLARACEIFGRPFVHINDYASWAGRQVPDDLHAPGMQEDGISWARWNKWIAENGVDGLIDVAGYRLSSLRERWDIRDGESLRFYPTSEQAELALAERLRALDQLYATTLRAASRSTPDFVLTDLQRRILDALTGEAMTADELSAKLKCDRRTLFKPGGINELLARNDVVNERKVGGYFRPDYPPIPTKK